MAVVIIITPTSNSTGWVRYTVNDVITSAEWCTFKMQRQKYTQLARVDKDFAKISDNREFQELLIYSD
ncbi:hypothetical protein [Cylindrospermopsis raciborskii]|uniref:hypothetical protein n=1 Tax=Cylindrospermopsis raciborskii TaxID=77022 RepID=UPI0015C41136|nr:hypothetical protein [Cylindrospermopsis raciborskii]